MNNSSPNDANFKFVSGDHPWDSLAWEDFRGDDLEEWVETKFERFPIKDIMCIEKLEELQNCSTLIYNNKCLCRTIDLFWEN